MRVAATRLGETHLVCVGVAGCVPLDFRLVGCLDETPQSPSRWLSHHDSAGALDAKKDPLPEPLRL